MNIQEIMTDAYSAKLHKPDYDAAKKALADEAFWQEWAKITANASFLEELILKRDTITHELYESVLNGSIDDTTLRVKLTEAATLNRVINAPLLNKGKY